MRHEVIQTKLHPLDCRCSLHREPGNRWLAVIEPSNFALVEPGDIAAIQKGLIGGAWLAGIAAAYKYTPTVIDWLTS